VVRKFCKDVLLQFHIAWFLYHDSPPKFWAAVNIKHFVWYKFEILRQLANLKKMYETVGLYVLKAFKYYVIFIWVNCLLIPVTHT
jgi:hypothetical protein